MSFDNQYGSMPLAKMIVYGPPIAGACAMLFVITFFVMNFGTDYLDFAPALFGTIFAIDRLWRSYSQINPAHRCDNINC